MNKADKSIIKEDLFVPSKMTKNNGKNVFKTTWIKIVLRGEIEFFFHLYSYDLTFSISDFN